MSVVLPGLRNALRATRTALLIGAWLALQLLPTARAAGTAEPAPPSPATTPRAEPATAAASTPTVTGTGQRIYERTRPLLLQVRTLLKTQDSQSSVGSGFLVDGSGLLTTW